MMGQCQRHVENRAGDNNTRKKAEAVLNVAFRFSKDLTVNSDKEPPFFGSNRSAGTHVSYSAMGGNASS